MHIGFLSSEYPIPDQCYGGLAVYIQKIGLSLIKRGHQVSVFTLSQRYHQWHDQGLAIYEIPRFSLPKVFERNAYTRAILPAAHQLLSAQRLARQVWRIHQQQPIDILQTASDQAVGFVLRRNPHIPLVCRVSSYTPLWRAAFGVQKKLVGVLTDWLEIRQVLDADLAFAPSHFLADLYSRLEACPLAVIPTPLDERIITHDQTCYQATFSGCTYLLYFGSLSRIKGVDLLADLSPTLLTTYPDLHLVLIGHDFGLPDGRLLAEIVQQNCREYAVADRLHYLPPLPKAQLYPIIANAWGVLMPSRADNCPNACLEAQMLGIPVVGTDESSLDELILDGETGFLAQNGDRASLYHAIERLLALSPTERQQMMTRILAQMDSIRQSDRIGQLLAVYQSVIDRRRSS